MLLLEQTRSNRINLELINYFARMQFEISKPCWAGWIATRFAAISKWDWNWSCLWTTQIQLWGEKKNIYIYIYLVI